MNENEIGTIIVDCAVQLHQTLGRGYRFEAGIPAEFRRSAHEGWYNPDN